MANSKISELTELTSPADTDEVAIVDKSDTTQASTGSTKRITRSNFLGTNLSAFEGITIKDEDDMASDSATAVPTQQSVKAYVDTYGFSGATFNAPQGFLLNGKIVPSVSSNNLTVALKTLAGTDPSATDPVYVMIGGVMRSVTSALSVTKNAGTNWFNSGSSELATYEIDYFVYLGYNATDGVVIGFSRIPYGALYSEFSATTTNEKYCAISTITNATASDVYTNIGRFAATLSAGAGYTWSVPTFTATNLIQRPIYEARTVTTASGYLLSIIGRKAILQGEVASGTNTVTGLYGWYRTDVNTITYPITYSVAPKAIVTSKSDHAGVMTTSVTATTLSWRGYAGASVASPPSCYFLIIGEL